MPVQATPTTPQIVTQDDIRGFLRDVTGQIPNTGVINILLDGPEYSDVDIQRAIKFTVARYNVMTPPSNDSQYSINPWLLLIGVSEFLMRSEAFRQNRNQLTYADGDVAPVGIDDKVQSYTALADNCKAEFEEKAKLYKVSQNLESCYGSLGSGYRAVSRFHHSS